MTRVRPLNLIRLVARLLELGVDAASIREALVFGGLPEEYADLCLSIVWDKECEQLIKISEDLIKDIRKSLRRLYDILSS